MKTTTMACALVLLAFDLTGAIGIAADTEKYGFYMPNPKVEGFRGKHLVQDIRTGPWYYFILFI